MYEGKTLLCAAAVKMHKTEELQQLNDYFDKLSAIK